MRLTNVLNLLCMELKKGVHDNLRALLSVSKNLGVRTEAPILRYRRLHHSKILYFIPFAV